MNLVVFGGSRELDNSRVRLEINKLASRIDTNICVIYGGGHTGLIANIPKIHHERGGKVIKVNSHLFTCDENDYEFHERQRKLIEMGDMYLVLPGGIGTMSELFDVLTRNDVMMLGKSIIVFNYEGFFDCVWQQLIHMDNMNLLKGWKHLNLKLLDNIDDIVNAINI
uniref:Putative lysine decarboxylase n=1 Tax=Megaviridae environmental sample TaxID=1737588 RepID=A0A5J6VIM6_9VIRU|nr:MAG: putative lysine decarboxylase [Megaviridae environmental sample]